jgi:hypothetical protein
MARHRGLLQSQLVDPDIMLATVSNQNAAIFFQVLYERLSLHFGSLKERADLTSSLPLLRDSWPTVL